ncbi:MAG: YggS family pyridoxal phosphate-dependent enzyme [Bacteroidota bacterium]
MISQNIHSIRTRIQEACLRSGRDPSSVLLLAVSKSFPPEMVNEAWGSGVEDFGENYVQELIRKQKVLASRQIRWHFVGHLQTNKVRQIVESIHLIHSVDNLRLVEEIQRRAEKVGRTIDVLVEVHTTAEATKFGVPPEKTVQFVREISAFDRVRVKGLMTMGPFSEQPGDSRPSFRTVAGLARTIDGEGIPHVAMNQLSMGMTHDFEIAVEEGATILRIGTAIFGPRQKSAA